jgi:hypothetical protein
LKQQTFGLFAKVLCSCGVAMNLQLIGAAAQFAGGCTQMKLNAADLE